MPEELSGRRLAEAAHLYLRRRDRYRSGIAVDELVKELEASGIRIGSDDPWSTLRTALNGAQDLFVSASEGRWRWVEEVRPVGTEISGRALAAAAHAFVRERYPRDRVFHYEDAKEQMIRQGVRIKGPVPGRTMLAALKGSPALFERTGRGMWRWKEQA